MTRILSLVLVAMVVMMGCESKPAEPPAPPPPPEPTADEIAHKMGEALGPMVNELQTGNISVTSREQALAQLRKVQSDYAGKKNLPEAQSRAASEVAGKLEQALTMEAWQATLAIVDVLAVLDPAHPKLERAKTKAMDELSRPKVGMPSFFKDEQNDATVVFLEVTYPDTGKVEAQQVREGEEFAEGKLRLKEIIGRNQGITIVYTKDGKEVKILRR